MVGDISGFDYFMTEKRTQNFSGESYFTEFDGVHNRLFRLA